MAGLGSFRELARVVLVQCRTGKTRYLTKDAAWDAVAHLLEKSARFADDTARCWPVRAYQCDQCGGWHITSRVSKR